MQLIDVLNFVDLLSSCKRAQMRASERARERERGGGAVPSALGIILMSGAVMT